MALGYTALFFLLLDNPDTDGNPGAACARPAAAARRRMTHFLAMGGYAAFVWPAYGVSVARHRRA